MVLRISWHSLLKRQSFTLYIPGKVEHAGGSRADQLAGGGGGRANHAALVQPVDDRWEPEAGAAGNQEHCHRWSWTSDN